MILEIGVSTACLYPMYTEQSLETLLTQGVRLFEIFLNSPSELRPDYLDGLKNKLHEAGARVISIHPFTSGYESYLLFSGYHRRFVDGMDWYEGYYRAAAQLGARFVVLHGEKAQPSSGIDEEEYFARFAELSARGKPYGVTLAQENVNLCRSADPGFIRRMRNALGEQVAFVLDVKQAVRAGFNPYDMCDAMGQRLVHLHVNDHMAGQDCLLPGRGGMDYQRLKTMLVRQQYCGDCVIEVYRRNFNTYDELMEAQRFLEKTFATEIRNML
jgi:sugar phosphate isomerase/epimerase